MDIATRNELTLSSESKESKIKITMSAQIVQRRIASITGPRQWNSLRKYVMNSRVEISHCRNMDLFRTNPDPDGPIFPCAEEVHLRYCDHEFVSTWLTLRTFPVAKEIYLKNDPCRSNIFRQWPASTKIYLPKADAKLKARWASDLDNVIVGPDSLMQTLYYVAEGIEDLPPLHQ